MAAKQPVAPETGNEAKIYNVRGQQVMLGVHLAKMHRIDVQALNEAVERNVQCFPENSMFRLTPEEFAGLVLPALPANEPAPYAFTGQGVAILSSLLFDERAIHESLKTRAATCRCRK